MSKGKEKDDVIGKTTATEKVPNTVEEFYFWVEPGKIINPFDFVSVEHVKGTTTVGMVSSMELITDAKSHLADYVSSEFGKVESVPQTPRIETTIAKAKVMGNITGEEMSEVLMPVGSNKLVRFASEEEVRAGLGLLTIEKNKRLPIGIIEMSNKATIPIYVDSDFLLGPQGAHLNISGITGLATKTSYIMFLIQLIYQKMEEKVAIIIFNVKQDDLLHLHELPTDITPEDEEMYKILGIKEEVFPPNDPQKGIKGIKYFLPRGLRGRPNSDHIPSIGYYKYAYSLEDSYRRLDLLFHGVPDPYLTMRGIIDWIMENYKQQQTYGIHFRKDIVDSRERTIRTRNSPVRTWEDLRLFEDYPSEVVRYIRTAWRFRGLLRQFTSSPLFVSSRAQDEVYLGEEIKKIKAGEIWVIDIAKITDEREQAFIIGDVMRSLDEMYGERNREEIPLKIIIYIDELNRYAPRIGRFEEVSPVTQQIREIARTGRSRGTVLFTAQQFMSSVDRQIIENSAMQVVGRSGSSELASDVYRFLDQEIKDIATRLKKGELIISHPTFRRPIKIKFPKPYYKRIG
ncbi:MAG: ATP-binding protein [Nitrososphaerota archaeon]